MYFKITKSFLNQRSKEALLDLFSHADFPPNDSKGSLVTKILKHITEHEQLKDCNSWVWICPYCRSEGFLATRKKHTVDPRFCTRCGKTTPYTALNSSLSNTEQLIILASKMNLREEQSTKNVLLEQSLVTVITGIEVVMREVYSLVYDLQHVVLGRSIYEDTYSRTRNEFLNLGSANRGLKKVVKLNLKSELSDDDYKFLSRMYSTRHIIVHNSSIKDKDYLSQTGEDSSELNQRLNLKVPDIRRLIRVTTSIAKKVEGELQKSILAYHQKKLSLLNSSKHQKK